jgi:hypothetical protein
VLHSRCAAAKAKLDDSARHINNGRIVKQPCKFKRGIVKRLVHVAIITSTTFDETKCLLTSKTAFVLLRCRFAK